MVEKLANIKELAWELFKRYIENPKKNNIDSPRGKKFIKKVEENPEVNKYQWRVKNSILIEVFDNFLLDILNYRRENPSSEKSQIKNYFNLQFQKLENEILLCDYFTFKLLIPAFRVAFAEGQNEIILDSSHKIVNIYDKEEPYGIPNFKKIPRFWEPFKRDERTTFSPANVAFEIIIKIKKRLATEPNYSENDNPIHPNVYYNRSQFLEKIYSIYDFFNCHGVNYYFSPFTFGDSFYIIHPPFTMIPYPKHIFSLPPYIERFFLGYQFHYAKGFLDLKDANKLNKWIECWRNNYEDFYILYYNLYHDYDKVRIFRYTLEVIRTLPNIPFTDLRVFNLVSTLEGYVFVDKIKKDLAKKIYLQREKIGRKLKRGIGKGIPMAKIFAKICKEQSQTWNIVKSKDQIFNLQYVISLERFLISAYQYRNNIAHPEKYKKIKFLPEELYNWVEPERKPNELSNLILNWFEIFLRFLLHIWVKKEIKDSHEWYEYIKKLF